MMDVCGHSLFTTHLGVCGLAWHEDTIVRVLLAHPDSEAASHALLPFGPNTTPTPFAKRTVSLLQSFIDEAPTTLDHLPISLDGLPPFTRKVLRACRTIPIGQCCTYGELAAQLGQPGSARAVGQALGRNPVPLIIPCHRVIATGGRIGGFTAPSGTHLKQRLLSFEGILI